MNESKWWNYVQAVTGGARIKDIADRVGIDKSNVSRWGNGARPAADFAVSFARAYGRPATEALAAASYITEPEAQLQPVFFGQHEALATATATELLEELLRRSRESAGDDELAARRATRSRGDERGEMLAVAHKPTQPPVHDPNAAPDYDAGDELPGDDDIA